MASINEYSIPPQSSEETRQRLYQVYRARLDEVNRMREEANRAESQNQDGPSRRRSSPLANGPTAQRQARMEDARSARSRQQNRSNRAETERTPNAEPTQDVAITYEPRAASHDVDLRISPYQRGLFVDIDV